VKLRTIDVPQADSLALVRRLLEVISQSKSTAVKELAARSGFSERHVRYRTQAARILGFLSNADGIEVSLRGHRLLATEAGSPAEKSQLRQAVARCAAVQLIAPDLLSSPSRRCQGARQKITAVSGLSEATAERRAVVLRSWHRDLA